MYNLYIQHYLMYILEGICIQLNPNCMRSIQKSLYWSDKLCFIDNPKLRFGPIGPKKECPLSVIHNFHYMFMNTLVR